MRSNGSAAVSVERFFQFSLLGLVFSGYLAVAGSGYLDTPTIALTAGGLVLRALLIAGLLRFEISDRFVTIATLAYIGWFPLDYVFFARGFLEATVHLVFFLAVMKVLTARTNRDYAYTAVIAFLELLAAAILSANLNFFGFLSVYLLFAMAAFTSGEIRRSIQRPHATARTGLRRFHSRLAFLTLFLTLGILALTGGLFFMLPRTAEAALDHFVSNRFYLPGFSSQVRLGEIGEVKNTSRPVMHVRFSNTAPPNLKWRGAALSDFDGRRWYSPPVGAQAVPIEDGRATLADYGRAMRLGRRITYQVDLNPIGSDTLFFAGIPEMLELRQPVLLRTPDDSYRLGRVPSQGIRYETYSVLEEPLGVPEWFAPDKLPDAMLAALPATPPHRSAHSRAGLAHGGAGNPPAWGARARWRTPCAATTATRSNCSGPRCPIRWRISCSSGRKGHCEYFASAMAVMLRTLGIPSRLVTGFQSGTWNPISEALVVRTSDAHSWVEAWLPGRGWTTFDPTPPDPNPRGATIFSRLSLWADAAETFWQDWVLGYDPNRQATLAERMERSSRFLSTRWIDRIANAERRWKAAVMHWSRRYGTEALGMSAACSVALWITPPLWRRCNVSLRVRRVRRGAASTADATLLYTRMLQILRRRGFQKPAWFTPTEFAASLPSELSGLVAQFTTAYNDVRFGGRLDAAQHLSTLLDRVEHQDH